MSIDRLLLKAFIHQLYEQNSSLSRGVEGFLHNKFISSKNSLWIVQKDTLRNGYRRWFPKLLRRQSSGGCRFNPDWRRVTILNTCTRLWLTESERVTPVDSIKDLVRSSAKVPEFDKHLKKAGGHIGRNVMEITIKMKTIVRKPLLIKISYSI